MNIRIGIIGKGFVGSAVEYGFSCDSNFKSQIKIFDKNPSLSKHSLSETINSSDFIFVSVPTPAKLGGEIDLKILDNALFEINECRKNNCIILIRSTITPGTSEMFSKKYPKLKIVFNPEFLTEKNANEDFINQSRIILGGDKNLTKKVSELYKKRFGERIHIIETNFQTAELIKYMNNCFLATKISYMNEMKLLSNKVNANWDQAIEGFIADPRVGNSHFNVPGHDGKYGFGGSCFPKDIQALIKFGEQIDIDTEVLKAVWKTNLKVRPEKDWEELKGRAVTD